MTSGAIQKTVPCIAVDAIPFRSSVRFEIPKSEILQIPVFSTKMLSAFKSYAETMRHEEMFEDQAYSVYNVLGVKVFQAFKNLSGE